MRKIEQLEEYILELRAHTEVALTNTLIPEEEEYDLGYLDALNDVVVAIERVWGWTSLSHSE